MVKLELPNLSHQEAFQKAVELSKFEKFDYFSINSNLTFKEWLDSIYQVPENFVSYSFYFAIVNNEIVGRVSIRHKLNDFLLKRGGHIGYGILPQYRNKGYATLVLAEALIKSAELNLKYVLLTCDKDNIASQKVIEKNYGIKEYGDVDHYRYWIKIR